MKLVKTRYLWTASDPWLGAVNGEDSLPDVAIGRLPAASVEELETLVHKILAYEMGHGDPEAPVVLITDNPDGAGDFDWNAEVLAATVLSGQEVEKIYLSQLGTTATRHLIVENAGHEDMLVHAEVRAVLADFFRGRDVSDRRVALPTPRFLSIAEAKEQRLGAR